MTDEATTPEGFERLGLINGKQHHQQTQCEGVHATHEDNFSIRKYMNPFEGLDNKQAWWEDTIWNNFDHSLPNSFDTLVVKLTW